MSTPKSAARKSSEHTQPGAAAPDLSGAYFLSLKLENVRCFGPEQTLDLSDRNGKPAPWTIILGVNGTGKSTILQSLVAFEATTGRAPPSFEDYWLPRRLEDQGLSFGYLTMQNSMSELRP